MAICCCFLGNDLQKVTKTEFPSIFTCLVYILQKKNIKQLINHPKSINQSYFFNYSTSTFCRKGYKHLLTYHMHCPEKAQQNDDSDNDEGFIVNTLEINQKERPKIVLNSTARPTDFQPRYVNGNVLIKKELPELISSYPHFPNEDQSINSKMASSRKDRENFSKIQEHSFPNKNYQLTYQRTNKKYDSESLNTDHNVNLASVVAYSADNYSILKNWDLKPSSEELIFESRFECGNLLYAYKNLAAPNHYVLFLQNDTNTKGYNKWFYFAVKNKKKFMTYTFSIVNFRKNMSFIKQGLRPTRFSVKEQEAKGNGWSKCNNHIHMYRSKIGEERDSYLFNEHYTLTFEAHFDYENDTNFFSLLPPYSYSKMMAFLQDSQKISRQRPDLSFKYQTISYSLTNTQVPYVTIGSPEPSKKNIVILARQHPGEVWSSFFVESFIRQLLRDSFADKEWLLKQFTFRIFPMINVDGVIYGNFRCDLSGTDLNRSWKEPNKLFHPHIVAIKEELRRLSAEEEIVSCFDLHAHSKQYNIFAYCCKTDNRSRLLPLLISKMSNLFYFPFCTFGISRFKETTARAVIYEITRAPDVLTFQSSFFAGSNPFKVISPSVFISFSNGLIKALKSYYSRDQQYDQAEKDLPKALAEVASLRSKNREKYALNEQSGSDSQPDIDEIAITQKIGKIIPKCALVQEAFGLKEEEQTKLQYLSRPKKDNQNKLKRQKRQEQLIRVAKNTISEEPMIKPQVQKPPTIVAKPRAKSNNTVNNFLERIMRKKEDRVEQRNRKQRQREKAFKQTIRPSFNESLEMKSNRKTLSKFLAEEFRSTFRETKMKYQMEEVYEKKQEEFPLLCILSENKREAHLEKLRRIHPAPLQRQKAIIRYQPTLVINKKLDTMQRLRQRQKKSSDLVSSLWKDTLGYDQEGPVTHIFYGGP